MYILSATPREASDSPSHAPPKRKLGNHCDALHFDPTASGEFALYWDGAGAGLAPLPLISDITLMVDKNAKSALSLRLFGTDITTFEKESEAVQKELVFANSLPKKRSRGAAAVAVADELLEWIAIKWSLNINPRRKSYIRIPI
ncbi:hypothetical protein FA15DRAFT_655185 [Coprinopsis marcescibilis]|uniref:Uncharacterized protein n=1 Tax=Coprinopsis marcescibilis TaxID=230819 RepID=A0A5C3KXS6_COPMA|nr:hypothetical protein FA15DRAFT_655185 [Coprinopsis marcescibilis]